MNLQQLVDFRNSLRSSIKTDSIHTEIKTLIKTISDISAHSLTDDFKQSSDKIKSCKLQWQIYDFRPTFMIKKNNSFHQKRSISLHAFQLLKLNTLDT